MKSFSEYLSEKFDDWEVTPGKNFESQYNNYSYAQTVLSDADKKLVADVKSGKYNGDKSKEVGDIFKALAVMQHVANVGRLSAEDKRKKDISGLKSSAPKDATNLLKKFGFEEGEDGDFKSNAAEEGVKRIVAEKNSKKEEPKKEEPKKEEPKKGTDAKPNATKPKETSTKDGKTETGESDEGGDNTKKNR